MPFALLVLGVVMLVVGVRGKTGSLLTLLDQDVLSSSGYAPWAVSILGIGAIGYVPRVKPLSDAFLGLVMVVLLISNKGFFAQFEQAIAGIKGGSFAGSGSNDGLTPFAGGSSNNAAPASTLQTGGVSLTDPATLSFNPDASLTVVSPPTPPSSVSSVLKGY